MAGRRFDILVIGADIADMREGEGDELAGIGGIGNHLLIAGHRGVEDQLADHGAGGTDRLAVKDRAVGEHQGRGGKGSTCRLHDGTRPMAEK
jgi:hypothetical protein